MKPTLFRLSALLLTFSVGVAIPQFFKRHHSIESSLAVPSLGVGSAISSRCASADYIRKGEEVVISIANGGEFYLGKRKAALSEIPAIVRKIRGNDLQVVFIKSPASVRFETLSLVADSIRNANVKCIEFVLDKKKRGGAAQPPLDISF